MLNKSRKINSYLLGLSLLNLAPLLWGSSYIVLKQIINIVSPSILNLISYTLAAICLTPFLRQKRRLTKAGLELGFWLLLGSATQTIGLQFTSASRSAFITTLYVVLVPLIIHFYIILSKILTNKTALVNSSKIEKITTPIWVTAYLALIGVGIISYDHQAPNIGDFWTLGTAFSYAFYIIRIENYARELSVLSLAASQVWGAVIFSVFWVLVDKSHWPNNFEALFNLPWLSLFYLGLVVTTCTICIQSWGQARVKSVQAAVIYTLEPVWGLVFAYLFLGEVLGPRGWIGAVIVTIATLLNQLYASSNPRSVC